MNKKIYGIWNEKKTEIHKVFLKKVKNIFFQKTF